MYTGALENRPRLVHEIARQRCLWGNDKDVLRRARSPRFLAQLLQHAGLPYPEIRMRQDGPPSCGSWLIKPVAGAGGSGVRFYDSGMTWPAAGRVYLQEYLEGESCAAVYVGDGTRAQLLGVTRQLVGEPWLNAAPFRYCGSIGPLALTESEQRAFAMLGDVLTKGCGLRGIFGVDCIRRDDGPWPVEVNPRYTASVEVLECATGVPTLALHGGAFGASVVPPPARSTRGVVGKVILYAREAFHFPGSGPWRDVLANQQIPWDMALADIPNALNGIVAGKPIMTVMSRASALDAVVETLKRGVRTLEECFPWR